MVAGRDQRAALAERGRAVVVVGAVLEIPERPRAVHDRDVVEVVLRWR